MPKFIIERNMAAVGNAPRSDLKNTSEKSNDVLKELGPKIQWLESYVTKDKIYCVYIAANDYGRAINRHEHHHSQCRGPVMRDGLHFDP
jgi:hypothetical protein